jgi:hypothetical protein
MKILLMYSFSGNPRPQSQFPHSCVCERFIHCKKSWWKTPPACPDVTDSLVRGTENFFDMKIKLIRRVSTTKMKYFEIIGISRWFFVLTQRSFPTVFRQLLTNETISKAAPPGIDPTTFRVTIYYSTLSLCYFLWQHTLFLAQYMFTFISTMLTFVSTVFSLVSTPFTYVNTVFFFFSIVLTFVSSVFSFVSTLFFFLSMVSNFVSTVFSSSVLCSSPYCVFLRQYCVYLRQYYRETWPGSSLSSRRVPRQKCHGRGANLRPPAPQADALPKELSRQLIAGY